MDHTDFRITKVNGKEFVAGLLWLPLSRPRAYMAEAREIGKKEGMDIVSIRTGQTMIQAGFVKKGDGIAKGMYSLATSLAGLIPEKSWIGAFKLPDDQYALVAVNRGLIVPGCDLIGERQEIRNFLVEKDSQVRGIKFDKVYHPDDFEYRGEALDIEQLLAPKRLRREFSLKQLTFGLTKRELLVLTGIFCAVTAAGLGAMQWQAYQARLAREEAARQEAIRQAQLAQLRAQAGEGIQEQALSHPWAEKASVHDFLEGCQGALNSLPLALGGWLFSSAICTGQTLETVYTRSKGAPSFAEFSQAAAKRFSSPATLLEGGERAGLGDSVTLAAGGDDQLMTTDDLRLLFLSHLQKLELKPEITEIPYTPPAHTSDPLPGQEKPKEPPAPDWRTFNFSISTNYAPETVFGGLQLSGVRLTEIAVARSEGNILTWSMKGELYAH